MSNRGLSRHKKAIQKIDELCDDPSNVKIIHYAAESTYQTEEDKAPRVTAIAILDFKSATITTFSIDKMAELEGIPISKIKDNYKNLEFKLLDEYFAYLKTHTDNKWVCWKMKDITYGYIALEFRYRVLGGEPILIPEQNKYQLSDLLKSKYGARYIEKGSDLSMGRMYQLFQKNHITKKHLLTGKDEADAFLKSEFSRITKSTSSKAEAFSYILLKAGENTLKTNSTLKMRLDEFYGFSPQGLFNLTKDNWVAALIGMLLGAFFLELVKFLLDYF